MAPRVSIRISIRWLPDPPSEPTDTIVFGVGDYYIDLRVLKSTNTIEWAMAGERVVIEHDPLRVKFTKTIDSLGLGEPDEGTFVKLPNGDDFETGKMSCPERGMAITDYEEVWRQIPPLPGSKRAWILESVNRRRKVFLGMIGGGYIALGSDDGDGFGARREEWDEVRKEWVVRYAIGALNGIPSMVGGGLEDESLIPTIKNTVNIGGGEYMVLIKEALE